MLGLSHRIRRFFAASESGARWVSLPQVRELAQARDAEAFERHTQLHLAFLGRLSAAICIVGALLWWPVDWIIYNKSIQQHGPPQAFRVTICVICALYLLGSRRPFFLRNSIWLLTALVTAVMATLGATAGAQGGLEQPWYHLAYPLLCASLLFPAPLRQRIVLVTMQALGSLGGLLLPHPEGWSSPYLPLSLSMVFLVSVVSTALGHYAYLLFSDNFRQAQALARSTAELEDRVTEKTQDLRDLLAHSEGVLDKERARISRDLHDELGQELTALRFAVALTHEHFLRDPQAIEKNLRELEHILQRARKTLRGLVSELRPLLLEDLGLRAAAEWLAQRVVERTGLSCDVQISGEDQGLSPELAATAYRLLQEALTNVARHAQATRAQVVVRISSDRLELSVTDDGVGFDPSQRGPGMGLLGMRERALALGAPLLVRSSPGAGTEIRCSLPLAASTVVTQPTTSR